MTEIQAEAVRWIASLASVLVAAFVGSLLALRKSKREKRWEARYNAYREILAAVHDMYYWAQETHASNLCLPSVGSEKLQKLSTRFDDAKHELSSFVHTGGLLISEEARGEILGLLHEISREEYRLGEAGDDDADPAYVVSMHCEKLIFLLSDRLPNIQELARHDLK